MATPGTPARNLEECVECVYMLIAHGQGQAQAWVMQEWLVLRGELSQ